MNRTITYYELEPSLDDIAKQHGYADYSDYCDEYFEGHTGGELGEPSYWDPDIDDHGANDYDMKIEEYCEGFADGYEQGYDDGYDDGWQDCTDYFESDSCDW